MGRVIKLTIISDVICPFCYIGHYELQEAIGRCTDLPVHFDIEYRPYRLTSLRDEDKPVDRVEYFRRKLGEQKIQQIRETITQWPKVQDGTCNLSFGGVISQSTKAHRLSIKAYKIGGHPLQEAVLTTIFKASCEQLKDIGDTQVLADVAESTGTMTRHDAINFLESDELKTEVFQMIRQVQSNGINGVPFVIIDGKWAVSGGQSAEVYIQIFRKLAATAIDSAPSPFPSHVVSVAA